MAEMKKPKQRKLAEPKAKASLKKVPQRRYYFLMITPGRMTTRWDFGDGAYKIADDGNEEESSGQNKKRKVGHLCARPFIDDLSVHSVQLPNQQSLFHGDQRGASHRLPRARTPSKMKMRIGSSPSVYCCALYAPPSLCAFY
jgi:hypothetical protein